MLTQEFTGRVWENGEFGISVTKTFKLESAETDLRTRQEKERAELMLNAIKVHGVEAVQEFYGLDLLGYSSLPKTHNRAQRGLKGITGHGKRMVRNACRRIEQEYSLNQLTFATFTLPDVSLADSVRVSRNWGEICRVFFQALRRKLSSVGLPSEIVHVTEIQEERSYRDKVLGLHLHCVFVGRQRFHAWPYTPKEYAEVWKGVLSRYLSRNVEEYNWTAVENVQRVKKSIEGYLGKYMSKGAKSLQNAALYFGEENMPSAWWGCTNSLRSRVLKRVRTLSGSNAVKLVNDCNECNPAIFVYCSPIVISAPSGRSIVVGWFGKLHPDWIGRYVGEHKCTQADMREDILK